MQTYQIFKQINEIKRFYANSPNVCYTYLKIGLLNYQIYGKLLQNNDADSNVGSSFISKQKIFTYKYRVAIIESSHKKQFNFKPQL